MKRILVIGFGSAGQRHSEIIMKNHLGFIPKVYDPRTLPYDFPTREELSRYTGFIIASPSDTHVEYLRKLAPYGKPILVEKPAVMSYAELQKFESDCGKEIFGSIYVGYQMRFLPSLQSLKTQLAQQEFGEIQEVTVYYGHAITKWNRPGHPPYTRRDGVLLEASHELDYIKWLFPGLEYFIGVCDATSVELESNATAVLQDGDGTLFTVQLNYLQPYYQRFIRIKGVKASAVFHFLPDDMGVAYERQLAEFLKIVTSAESELQTPTLATLADSWWVLDIIKKIREANNEANNES